MYRVMIIDDEEPIREGLKTLIDWSSCGFEIVGEAADGRQALAHVPLLHPDVIITDIQMPEINGLELVRQLQHEGFAGFFILVSGFAEFSYAQAAIRYGVKSYLLKPLDERALVGELYSIRKELEKTAAKQLGGQISSLSMEKLTERFITGLLPLEEVRSLLDPKWVSPGAQGMQVILIRYSIPYENTEKYHALKEEMMPFLNANRLHYLFSGNKMFALLSVNQAHTNTLIFHRLKQQLEETLDLYVEISIGCRVFSPEELPSSYQSADGLFDKLFLYGYKGLVSAETIPGPSAAALPAAQSSEPLILAIEYNNLPDINSALEQFQNYFIEKNLSEMEVKTEYINLFLHITDHFLSAYPDIRPEFYDKQGFIEQAYLKNSIMELNAELKARFASLSTSLEQFHPDNIMEKMIYYIDCNYSKNISITTISQYLHYNRTYLGRKFKKYTGDFFNDYLDKVRVSKAKELLQKGYKVYQVAEMVGYSNVDYFNAKFRKYENIPPSQYKKQQPPRLAGCVQENREA